MYSFILINEVDPNDPSPLAAQLTPQWLAQCAAAIQTQLTTHVSLYWPDALGARVAPGDATSIRAGEVAFAIVSKLDNAPGAEAYHDVNGQAVPVAFLALDTCSTLDDVSTGISHECIETVGDPDCNLWGDDNAGSSWARELCDAVQAGAYQVAGVAVSDFVLPAFFATGAAGPFHFLATPSMGGADLAGPFATQQGGYQLTRQQGQGEQQVFGSPTEGRRRKFAHALSRYARRRAHHQAARATAAKTIPPATGKPAKP